MRICTVRMHSGLHATSCHVSPLFTIIGLTWAMLMLSQKLQCHLVLDCFPRPYYCQYTRSRPWRRFSSSCSWWCGWWWSEAKSALLAQLLSVPNRTVLFCTDGLLFQ